MRDNMGRWASGPTDHAQPGSDDGKVGYRGCQEELEQGPGTAEVAGLPHSQLHQPGQPVLHHLAPPAVLSEGVALLQCSGLLKKRFLRVQGDGAPSPFLGGYASGPERA